LHHTRFGAGIVDIMELVTILKKMFCSLRDKRYKGKINVNRKLKLKQENLACIRKK
jgi:hypothetical protein